MSLYLGNTPIANTGYDKANTDLSNLTSIGKNIANWSNNVTNCITEIPQDIKLELNNGTLTLKAGSKVYFGDGSSYTLTSDTARSGGSYGSELIFFLKNSKTIRDMGITYCVSGSTQPTGGDYFAWYDTTNNIVKYTNNGFSTWEECSFPVALTTFTNNVPTSIDQVFNGFGYIGSTVFALPGVKGLAPNGRNADGTLKNIEFTTSSVLTKTEYWSNEPYILRINSSQLSFTRKIRYFVQETEPHSPSSQYDLWYNTKDNTIKWDNNSQKWNTVNSCYCGDFAGNSSNNIASLAPKTAFHAVDYNDSSTISGWAMPSSRYIDLTLGASGSTYTAPANGYIYVDKMTSSTNQRVAITGKVQVNEFCPVSGNAIRTWIPVKQGDTFSVIYNANGTTIAFRFIYAEGEN